MTMTTTTQHTTIKAAALLRLALGADGFVSLSAGVLTCVLLQSLQPLIGASSTHLLAVGIFMAAYGLAVGVLSRSTHMDRRLVSTIVYGNAGWVVASLALLFTAWIDPSALGVLLIVGQAAAVAVLSAMQFVGLRRSECISAGSPVLQLS
jgi:hypothetical protein